MCLKPKLTSSTLLTAKVQVGLCNAVAARSINFKMETGSVDRGPGSIYWDSTGIVASKAMTNASNVLQLTSNSAIDHVIVSIHANDRLSTTSSSQNMAESLWNMELSITVVAVQRAEKYSFLKAMTLHKKELPLFTFKALQFHNCQGRSDQNSNSSSFGSGRHMNSLPTISVSFIHHDRSRNRVDVCFLKKKHIDVPVIGIC